MQKLKSRSERSRGASKTLSLAIRCGANLLPVKGLLYAMAHAKTSRHVSGSSRSGIAESQKRVVKQIKELTELASSLQAMREIDGQRLYKNIKLATISYVDLFYNLDSKERDMYLQSYGGRHSKKIENEQNLLLIPAIMASRGESKQRVAAYLVNAIYKIPFRVLYHSSKAAMHIELLQQAMGIKEAPDGPMKRFSVALTKVDKTMKRIEDGELSPEEDEQLKERFVDEAVLLSQSTDMNIADFISEKVMPNVFTERMAKKVIRRL